jgi:hypothetical protein
MGVNINLRVCEKWAVKSDAPSPHESVCLLSHAFLPRPPYSAWYGIPRPSVILGWRSLVSFLTLLHSNTSFYLNCSRKSPHVQLTKFFPNACSVTRILSYGLAFVDLFTGALTGVEKLKVKLSLYRLRQATKASGGWGFWDFQTAGICRW